jgi:integrase/recombinase XerD
MIKELTIEYLWHRNNARVFLRFEKDDEVINLIRTLPNAQWSATQRAWHVAYSEIILQQICDLFYPLGVRVFKKNTYDSIKLPQILIENTIVLPIVVLNTEARDKIKEFTYWLRSKRYSESTISTYTESLSTFLKYFNHKSIQEITNDDVIKFNNEYVLARNLSASFQNQVVNAIKLFFKTIVLKSIETEKVHRPKRPKLLPNVLSKEEVKAILKAHINLKHKAMLSLIYACGLRCGELLRLKPEHIDSKRHVLIIKQSKGRKDRIAPLSESIIKILRDYFVAFKPTVYLFEGQHKGTAYDERSLQHVLKQAVVKVGINKPVSLHWLRHSYATHLLENGTDLRYIQEILGHSSSRTTEIYTHVSTKSIQNIISPFDFL